jgi:hypothetical protein
VATKCFGAHVVLKRSDEERFNDDLCRAEAVEESFNNHAERRLSDEKVLDTTLHQ